jgi:nitrite reductase/ring-hydroxylating ferredoxin subunit
VVIGSWTSANVLDLLGGDDDGSGAEKLIGVGIAAYGATAVTGTIDWADGEMGDPRVRRLGLVHAASNAAALGLYTASLLARRRGDQGRGKALALAGAAVMGAAGFLGGHLTYARGVGVNQTAFDEGPSDWTDAGASDDVKPGEPTAVVVGDTPVMLLRHGDHLHAIHDRCSHRGCSLSDKGEVDGEIVTCSCHGSQFDLHGGTVQRGPATVDQPVYEVRESGGRIELKLQSAD